MAYFQIRRPYKSARGGASRVRKRPPKAPMGARQAMNRSRRSTARGRSARATTGGNRTNRPTVPSRTRRTSRRGGGRY